ncbi:MAG TPA: hypothetical protein VIZ90_03910, partial [Rhizobiaceae bacterium]
MIGSDAPDRPERRETEAAEYGQQAPPPQETSTAAIAPATASPTPVRKAPRSEPPRTEAAWLPPGLGALLPRLALAIALLAIPVAVAFALQAWLARTQVAYDGSLRLPDDGGADEVTALHWSGDG